MVITVIGKDYAYRESGDLPGHAPDQPVNRFLSDDPTDHSNRIPAYIPRFRR